MTIATFGLNTTNTVQQWEDVYLSQAQPDINSPGGVTRVYISNVSGSQNKTVFKAPGIKAHFDTVGPVTVNSVVLKWRRPNSVTAPSRNVELRKLLVPFSATQAAWNRRLTGVAWETPGAIGAADVDSTVLATGLMPATGSQYFNISGAGLTAWGAGIVSGAIANDFGFTLTLENPTTTGSGNFDLNSGDDGNGNRPFLEIDYTTIAYPTASISDVTVNNLSGNATLTVTLSSDALAGGVAGTINTNNITALAGVDYTGQVNVAFSIAEGQSSGQVVIPILP